MAALLVLGGGNTSGDVLVIPINNAKRTCEAPLPRVSQPADGEGSVAAVLDGKITVCGGDYTKNCVAYNQGLGEWEKAGTMDMFRPYADGAKMGNDGLWITGGGVVSRDSNPTASTVVYKARLKSIFFERTFERTQIWLHTGRRRRERSRIALRDEPPLRGESERDPLHADRRAQHPRRLEH